MLTSQINMTHQYTFLYLKWCLTPVFCRYATPYAQSYIVDIRKMLMEGEIVTICLNGFIPGGIFALGLLVCGILYRRLQKLKQENIQLQKAVDQHTQKIQRQKDKIKKQAKKLKVSGINFKAQESQDIQWLQHIRDIVKRGTVNRKYKVSDLVAEMLVSESHLQKKMKQLTGLTPRQFIREIQLQKAQSMLKNKSRNTIAEISYEVGFKTPEYFSNIYEKRFGKRPLEYLARDTTTQYD